MRARALVGALLVASAALGCNPSWGDAYLHSLAAGTRAYHGGRYLEAAAAYHDAAAKAQRVKDRDEALFLEARMLERAGRYRDAIERDRALATLSPTGPRTERARYLAADLEIEHGDAAAGWKALEDTLVALPNAGNARAALDRLLGHVAREGGDEAAVAWLVAHRDRFAPTELDQTAGYERGNALERLGRLDEARDAWLAAARAHPYPHGSLTDDCFWKAADVELRQKRPQAAIALLREMLVPLERSGNPGSYTRPRFPAAQQRIAEIYRDALHDHASARREFHALYEKHVDTILRDDALWNEARLAKEDGDVRAACDVMDRLTKQFPTSRYARCAREICPSAAASKQECAGYLVRALSRPAGAPEPDDDPSP
jgi:tetratricopeptide (TPR) repeat protein